MTSTEEWRRWMPSRRQWVTPPAYGLVGFVAAVVATGWFFLARATGQIVDQLALLGARSYHEAPSGAVTLKIFDAAAALTGKVVGLVGVPFAIVVTALLLVLTAWRRSWARGLGAIILFAGANLTTQAIKAFVDRPDLGLYPTYGNSWPSGHTTMGAAAVLALMLLVPARGRWAVAVVGSVFISLMAWGTLINGWHRPSDTVAAICVSAIWYVLVETIRRSVMQVPLEEPVLNPIVTRVMDTLAGIGAALGIGILAALILTLPDTPVEGIEVATKRLAFLGAFFGIGTVAMITSRVVLTVGPREAEPRN